MTTKSAGGKITGLLALTCEAQSALEIGDPVMVTGDYEVDTADGTKPVLGHVSVKNVKRESTNTSYTFPVAAVPGDVTVEARGYSVRKVVAGAAITAGEAVGVGSDSKTHPVGTGVAEYGIALTLQDTVDGTLDVLVR